MKLTKREIDRLVCPPGKRDMLVTDDEIRGFAIRVTDKGSKIFLFQYRQGALVRRLVLGRYGDLTPSQARELAEKARGRMLGGLDLVADRKKAQAATADAERSRRRLAKAEALTLDAVLTSWADKGLQDRRPSYRHEADRALRINLKRHLERPVHELDAVSAVRIIDEIGRVRGAPMARRTQSYARAMFNWAIRRHLLSVNPFTGLDAPGRDVARDRTLDAGELGEVWRAFGIVGAPFDSFLRILLLTLQRRNEVAGMRWDEIAPDHSIWTVPAGRAKNGKAHIVHLAQPARDVLRSLADLRNSPLVFAASGRSPISGYAAAKNGLEDMRWDELDPTWSTWTRPAARAPDGKSHIVPLTAGVREVLQAMARAKKWPLVFTTTGRSPLSGFSTVKARLDEAMQKARQEAIATGDAEAIATWRLHDLRRSGVTALAGMGFAPHVCDRLLNHVEGTIRGVAAVYQRHEFLAERKKALDAWADYVLTAALGPPAQ